MNQIMFMLLTHLTTFWNFLYKCAHFPFVIISVQLEGVILELLESNSFLTIESSVFYF